MIVHFTQPIQFGTRMKTGFREPKPDDRKHEWRNWTCREVPGGYVFTDTKNGVYVKVPAQLCIVTGDSRELEPQPAAPPPTSQNTAPNRPAVKVRKKR